MSEFKDGLKKGIPIALGYLAVSFSFGVVAINKGLSPILAVIISATNLSSAGQYAGIEMILTSVSYIEILFTILLINLRYSLMSLSLSQKIEEDTKLYHRLLFGFGITDEVYALSVTEAKKLNYKYMYGLVLLPFLSWVLGTALGVLASNILPEIILNSLGISLYAMFIAIIIPDARRSLAISVVIIVAVILSCCFYYIPYIKELSIGLKIIISTVVASLVGTIFFPIRDNIDDI